MLSFQKWAAVLALGILVSPSNWAQPMIPAASETIGPPTPTPEPPLPPLPPGAAALTTQPARPKDPMELRIQKTQKISLEEAIQIAVERAPALQTANLQVAQAQLRVQVAEAALLPTVNLNTSYTFVQSSQTKFSQNIRSSVRGGVNFISPIDTSNFASTLQANWTFFSFGAVQAQIEAAQQSLRSNQLTLDIAAQGLKLQVTEAYFNLQLTNSQVDIAQAALRNAQASLRDARAQERAGTGTRFAVLQSEVQVTNADQQRLVAQNQSRIAQRNLATLLNFATPTDLTVDTAAQNGAWELSLEDSIFRALNNRTELQQLETQQKVSLAQAEASRASVLPTLTLSSSYDVYQDFNFSNLPLTQGYSFAVTLRWNLYDAGVANAQANQALRQGDIANVQFTDTVNTIRLGVESSFFTLQSSSEQITTARRGEALAKESLRLARLRFTSGVGTQTDVINAENALTQAQGNLAQAIINYNISLAQLKRALNLL